MNSKPMDSKRFFRLCEEGDLERVKQVYPIMEDSVLEQAFAYACRAGSVHVAKWLLEINPRLDIHSCNHMAFYQVCGYLEYEGAKFILSLTDRNTVDDYYAYYRMAYMEDFTQILGMIKTYIPNFRESYTIEMAEDKKKLLEIYRRNYEILKQCRSIIKI